MTNNLVRDCGRFAMDRAKMMQKLYDEAVTLEKQRANEKLLS